MSSKNSPKGHLFILQCNKKHNCEELLIAMSKGTDKKLHPRNPKHSKTTVNISQDPFGPVRNYWLGDRKLRKTQKHERGNLVNEAMRLRETNGNREPERCRNRSIDKCIDRSIDKVHTGGKQQEREVGKIEWLNQWWKTGSSMWNEWYTNERQLCDSNGSSKGAGSLRTQGL